VAAAPPITHLPTRAAADHLATHKQPAPITLPADNGCCCLLTALQWGNHTTDTQKN